MTNTIQQLIAAEEKAIQLFSAIESEQLIKAGKSERQLNMEVFQLAEKLFNIQKYWHKRIVRSGRNTLLPYQNNPANLILQQDDIMFFDFGPVFEEWEADIGRTYVLGNDPQKEKLRDDVEKAWQEGYAFYLNNKEQLTGADLYQYTCKLAQRYGWEYGNVHCGHLIGNFPHERISGEIVTNYIHPDNTVLLSEKDKNGYDRNWIYEIHFIDKENQIGAFFEQMMR